MLNHCCPTNYTWRHGSEAPCWDRHPQGCGYRATTDEFTACLSKVLPVYVGCKQWFLGTYAGTETWIVYHRQRHAVDPSMGARTPHPTTMDGGSAGFASLHGCNLLGQCRSSEAVCRGAIFSHSIHGDSLKLFQTIFSIHSIHGDKKLIINIKKTTCHLDQRERSCSTVV